MSKKLPSGTQRLKAKGLKGISLAVPPETKEILQKAAKLDGRSMQQFLVYYGTEAAKKVIARRQS